MKSEVWPAFWCSHLPHERLFSKAYETLFAEPLGSPLACVARLHRGAAPTHCATHPRTARCEGRCRNLSSGSSGAHPSSPLSPNNHPFCGTPHRLATRDWPTEAGAFASAAHRVVPHPFATDCGHAARGGCEPICIAPREPRASAAEGGERVGE